MALMLLLLAIISSSFENKNKSKKKCFPSDQSSAFLTLYVSFVFIIIGFTATLASADDHPIDGEFPPPPPPILIAGKQYQAHLDPHSAFFALPIGQGA